MLVAILSVILMSVFIFISFLHFYWVLGGQWATDRVFPPDLGTLFTNGKMSAIGLFATIFVAIAFLFFAYIVAANSGRVLCPFSMEVLRTLLVILSVIFAIRAIGDFKYCGFFKKRKASLFAYWDSKLYSPLCLTISIGLIALVLL